MPGVTGSMSQSFTNGRPATAEPRLMLPPGVPLSNPDAVMGCPSTPELSIPSGPKLNEPVTGRQAGLANGDQTGVPKPAPLLKLMFELRSSQGFL